MSAVQNRYRKVVIPEALLNSDSAVYGKGAGLLGAPGLIERFDVYCRVLRRRINTEHLRDEASESKGNEEEVVVCDTQFGRHLTGHVGLVHGGMISLLFDEAIGWGYQHVARNERSECGDGPNRGRTEVGRVDESTMSASSTEGGR